MEVIDIGLSDLEPISFSLRIHWESNRIESQNFEQRKRIFLSPPFQNDRGGEEEALLGI